MTINIPYYEDNSRYSNSTIGQYLKYGPQYLRNYLDGKEEGLNTKYLDKGSMIHMYILQPDEFWKEYEIREYEKPKSTQQQLFCDLYKKDIDTAKKDPFFDHETFICSIYRKVYKNIDEKTIADKSRKLYEIYKDFLLSNTNKKSITFADLAMLKKVADNIKNHTAANWLLSDSWKNAHNEFHINWEFPAKYYDISLPCKSLLDRFIIDFENKTLYLIDLKTTSNLYDFEHSMQIYDYARQFQYYWMAIEWYMKDVHNIDIVTDDYRRETYVISISTIDYQIRVFNIDDTLLEDRIETITSVIKELSWHHTHNKWDHTREYYERNGIEKLKIHTIDTNK